MAGGTEKSLGRPSARQCSYKTFIVTGLWSRHNMETDTEAPLPYPHYRGAQRLLQYLYSIIT